MIPNLHGINYLDSHTHCAPIADRDHVTVKNNSVPQFMKKTRVSWLIIILPFSEFRDSRMNILIATDVAARGLG